MLKEVAQIYYVDYNQKLKSEHENYWRDLDSISRLIALYLEYYETKYFPSEKNNNNLLTFCEKRTTISVSQYKEKFGTIRVYWTPADPTFVTLNYDNLNVTEKKITNLEQFREKCYVQDNIHYRNTYFTFRDLFPQYWKAMFDGADNQEYLIETKEKYLELIKTSEYFSSLKEEVFNILNWND